MSNLLRAGFARLFRSRMYWIVLALTVVICYFNVYQKTSMWSAERICFDSVPVVLFFVPIFIARFIGAEYEGSAMRNMLIVGKRKSEIYISNVVVCSVGNIILLAVTLLSTGIFALTHYNKFVCEPKVTLFYVICAVLITVSSTAVFTLLSLLNSKTAVNAVVCILLVIGILVVAMVINEQLSKPKMREMLYSDDIEYLDSILDPEEQQRYWEEHAVVEPNPRYVGGAKRKVYELLQTVNPMYQANELSNAALVTANSDEPEPLRFDWIMGSIGLTASTTALGLLLFRRKDIE